MDLFVYLQIAPIESIRFEHPITNWVGATYTDTILFDADNHSEALIIAYGKDMIEKANRICVLIDASPNLKLGGVITLIEKLVRSKKKHHIIFLNGENNSAEKMLSFSKVQIKKGLLEIEIQNQINDFVRNS